MGVVKKPYLCAMDKNELFICACHNVEHQLVFSYSTDEKDDREVYCSVHLIPESNIFKRMWNALRYVCGHRSMYGDFDEFIFKKEDAGRLREVADYLGGE